MWNLKIDAFDPMCRKELYVHKKSITKLLEQLKIISSERIELASSRLDFTWM